MAFRINKHLKIYLNEIKELWVCFEKNAKIENETCLDEVLHHVLFKNKN